MEGEQYDLMFAQEEQHWWYVGMRRISTALLERRLPRVADATGRPLEILDAGCGSGGMTRYLQRFGRVTGIDLAPEAVSLAKQRGLTQLARSSVGAMPFRDGAFDVVTSFDVLYHLNVNDDRAALSEIHRVLRPGGIALIRLPAFDWIRRAHDDVVHTRHRYTRDELSGKLDDVGLLVEHATYANFLLFPLAPVKRYLDHRNGTQEATDVAPARLAKLRAGPTAADLAAAQLEIANAEVQLTRVKTAPRPRTAAARRRHGRAGEAGHAARRSRPGRRAGRPRRAGDGTEQPVVDADRARCGLRRAGAGVRSGRGGGGQRRDRRAPGTTGSRPAPLSRGRRTPTCAWRSSTCSAGRGWPTWPNRPTRTRWPRRNCRKTARQRNWRK